MGNWLRHIHVALAAGSLALASMAQATTTTAYQLLLQSRVDTAAPNEVYLASFASLDDVITETIGSPTGFTDIDVTPDYQIAGMTWDGAAYRVLLQSRADTAAPAEVFLASFATLDDLFSETLGSPTEFTQIGVTPDFQIAGLTWDGTAYRVVLQSRVDAAAPNEVYVASFATLDDLMSETVGTPSGFTEINVTPDYRISDLTWDGAAYRVLLQSRADTAAPTEVFLASFATLDDLFSETLGSPTEFTQIDVTPAFQIVGFSSVTTVMPPPPAVPEPTTWSLLIIGFGATGFVMRRRSVAGVHA
jgi:hypothetical protein